MIYPPKTFQTERLRLRKPTLEDADVIFCAYAQDSEVTKYLTWRPHRNTEDTHEFIRSCLAGWNDAKSFHWAIIGKKQNKLIGMIAARVDAHRWELGYVLTRAYWGKGYMTEAVKALLQWALTQPDIYRVWSVCDVDNVASARVMEKAGMTKEGILRRWSIHPNISEEPRDSYCYAATK